jgi:hypothetical protein
LFQPFYNLSIFSRFILLIFLQFSIHYCLFFCKSFFLSAYFC